MKRILASVPVYHSIDPVPFLHFLILSQQTGKDESDGKYAVRWMAAGPKVKTIDARNTASHYALVGGASHLLLIDDDMVVPGDMVEKLLAHDVDIVSPIFFRSVGPIEPLAFNIDELGNRFPIFDYPEDCLFEAPGGVGTGVMLIKIGVLEAMQPPFWKGSEEPTVAEDVEFCRKAKELGFRSWCDSSVKVSQMNLPSPVGEAEYRRIRLTRR